MMGCLVLIEGMVGLIVSGGRVLKVSAKATRTL